MSIEINSSIHRNAVLDKSGLEVSFEVLDWRGFLILSPCWPEPIDYGRTKRLSW
jgi:hypothetical protein